jgi:hypothetical protein
VCSALHGRARRSDHHQRSETQPERRSVEITVSSNGRQCRQRNSLFVKQSKHLFPKSQTGQTPSMCSQHAHVHIGDGFVGSELETAPSRKLRRRGKTISRVLRSNIGVAGLRLASGSLPTPTIHFGDLSAATEPFDAIHTSLHPDSLNATKVTEQPEITTSQDTMRDAQAQYRQTKQWERAVQSQLSRITAPIRRDSESSGSQMLTEQQSIIDDSDDNHEDFAVYHLKGNPQPEPMTLLFEAYCH